MRNVVMAILVALCGWLPVQGHAQDSNQDPNSSVLQDSAFDDCMSALGDRTSVGRQRASLYLGELKGVEGSQQAVVGASVCNGALSRAQQYFRRQVDGNEVCGVATDYAENQVVQLFKSAGLTCRNEFNRYLATLSPDAQAEVASRVQQKEKSLR